MLKIHVIIPVCISLQLLGCEQKSTPTVAISKLAITQSVSGGNSDPFDQIKTQKSRKDRTVDNTEQQAQIKQLLEKVQTAIAKKDYTNAEVLLQQVLQLDPTNLSAGKAQRQINLDKIKQVADNEKTVSVKKKKQAEELAKKKEEFASLMKEGKEALAAEDYEQAANAFSAARKLNPEDADAAMYLGMAKRDQEREKAEVFQKEKEAEEQKQQEARAAQEEKNKRMKSDEELRVRLKADKERADALKKLNQQQFDQHMTVAKKAMHEKKYADAISALDKALQLLPEDKPAKELQSLARKELEASKKRN